MIVTKDEITPAVPEKIKKVEHYRVCDICGIESFNEFTVRGEEQTHWENDIDICDFAVTKVSMKFGYMLSHGDGAEYKEEEYHICPECFDSKLKPIFKTGPETTSYSF